MSFIENKLILTVYFHRVLMLGAGFVTRPTLDILSESGISVTVGMVFPRPNDASRLAH